MFLFSKHPDKQNLIDTLKFLFDQLLPNIFQRGHCTYIAPLFLIFCWAADVCQRESGVVLGLMSIWSFEIGHFDMGGVCNTTGMCWQKSYFISHYDWLQNTDSTYKVGPSPHPVLETSSIWHAQSQMIISILLRKWHFRFLHFKF